MAANFEIYIASNQYIDIQKFNNIWNTLGNNVAFDDSWILPSFLFSRKEMSPIKSLTQSKAVQLLQGGKIIEYNGTINHVISIGIHQYIEQDKYYMSTLWFDTERLPQFDSCKVSSEIESLYLAIVKCIKECGVLFFAMGSELMLKFSTNYTDMINNSRGVLMWWFKDEPNIASLSPVVETIPKTHRTVRPV